VGADPAEGVIRHSGDPSQRITSTGAGSRGSSANPAYVPSSAVVPRHQIQMRPAHFFDVGSRQANVGEQMVIEFEKLPVLVLSIQPQRYCAQPRKRDFPGPSKVRK
jgi:hypothetical protein